MTDAEFEGIYPPVPTPYSEEGEVDGVKFENYLDFLSDNEIHGVFLLGTNGEGPLLDFDEKKKIIEIAVDHLPGDVKKIVGTACPGIREAIKIGKYAEKIGADALHAVTPYYYPTSGQGLMDFYTKISENVELPLFVYYIPSRTGNEMDLETFSKLIEISNVTGIKDSSKDLGWFQRAVEACSSKEKDFTFFAGTDAYSYFYLMLGADGAVSAVANVFPSLVVEMYEAFRNRDHERALDLQGKILEVRRELKRGPYMSGVKAALKARGMDLGGLRSPLQNMGREERREMESHLAKLDLL